MCCRGGKLPGEEICFPLNAFRTIIRGIKDPRTMGCLTDTGPRIFAALGVLFSVIYTLKPPVNGVCAISPKVDFYGWF